MRPSLPLPSSFPAPEAQADDSGLADLCRENDIEGVIDTEMIDEIDVFGTRETVELLPGGASIAVTNDNKKQYVQLLCEHRLKGRVEAQLAAFVQGIHEIVKPEALAIFDEKELELLIGGLSDINVDDWQKHTGQLEPGGVL